MNITFRIIVSWLCSISHQKQKSHFCQIYQISIVKEKSLTLAILWWKEIEYCSQMATTSNSI